MTELKSIHRSQTVSYKYYIADVFTKEVFNGAQVAVFPNAEGLNNQQMSLLSRELNLTETAFLFPKKGEKNSYKMKVFTPRKEIDFAGHPIIAAAYVLANKGDVEIENPYTTLMFEQNSGVIRTNVTWAENHPSFVQFKNTVSSSVDFYTPSEGELASFLGINQDHIDNKKYSSRLVSCDFPYLIVPVFYYETVKSAKFNYTAWSRSIAPQTAAQEILLFAPKTPFPDTEFSVRLVGPNIGLHDDPPVGTAMPAFASYLCSFDHLQKGTYTFAVERGDEKVRRSVINLEMDHKKEDTLNLRIGGNAVMVAEGTINIP